MQKPKENLKILFWDIETSLLLMAAFTRYELRVPFSMITQDWFMFCAAYQWLGEKKPTLVSILDDPQRFRHDFTDDYHVVKHLRDVIDKADVLVAHNGNNFDWKKFKAKLIAHNIPPPRKPFLIDTYRESRSSKFTSGKLGDLAIQLELPHKASSTPGDWLMSTLPYGTYTVGSSKLQVTPESKAKAIASIGKYNLRDIPPLLKLYKRLRPYMMRHPNMNRFTLDNPGCPVCNAGKPYKNGVRGGIQTYLCKNCGHNFRATTGIRLTYKT